VDVSAYAGQSGELRFTSPWLASGLLDDVRFSSVAIPEPSALALCSLGVLILFGAMKRPNTNERHDHNCADKTGCGESRDRVSVAGQVSVARGRWA